MDETVDFVVIGAGPAGEAATDLARLRGASVAVIDRELFASTRTPQRGGLTDRNVAKGDRSACTHGVRQAIVGGQSHEEIQALLRPVQSLLFTRRA